MCDCYVRFKVILRVLEYIYSLKKVNIKIKRVLDVRPTPAGDRGAASEKGLPVATQCKGCRGCGREILLCTLRYSLGTKVQLRVLNIQTQTFYFHIVNINTSIARMKISSLFIVDECCLCLDFWVSLITTPVKVRLFNLFEIYLSWKAFINNIKNT